MTKATNGFVRVFKIKNGIFIKNYVCWTSNSKTFGRMEYIVFIRCSFVEINKNNNSNNSNDYKFAKVHKCKERRRSNK